MNTVHRPTNVLVNVKWDDINYVRRYNHAKIFKEWNENNNTKNWVLVNYRSFHEPQFMFLTEGVAYSKMPSEEKLKILKNEGYTVIVYDPENDGFAFSK